jgi:hypothetical protein
MSDNAYIILSIALLMFVFILALIITGEWIGAVISSVVSFLTVTIMIWIERRDDEM